jgi:hypothetical protein
MDNTYELTALRSIREATIATRDLENQATATAKRYKKGIKLINAHIATIERSLDEGGLHTFDGLEPWTVADPKINRLISNPVLENIEEDNTI